MANLQTVIKLRSDYLTDTRQPGKRSSTVKERTILSEKGIEIIRCLKAVRCYSRFQFIIVLPIQPVSRQCVYDRLYKCQSPSSHLFCLFSSLKALGEMPLWPPYWTRSPLIIILIPPADSIARVCFSPKHWDLYPSRFQTQTQFKTPWNTKQSWSKGREK